MSSRTWAVVVSLLLLIGAAFLGPLRERPARADAPPAFDDAFWKHWGDGRAELASYDLTFPRYGAARPGVAIVIFVTETFSNESRVKADPGVHKKSDEFPVMKLNLVQDFRTGLYDYNLMTSVFTSLAGMAERPAGSVAKISFSAQDWCGHVYHQVIPSATTARFTSHSYFDGEADLDKALTMPRGAVFEDALLSWARGFTAPHLEPGASADVQMLRSSEVVRLQHEDIMWEPAKLSRSAAKTSVHVPAGTFEVETFTAVIPGKPARTWTISVETAAPRRIIRWETTDGKVAELISAERLSYWELNGESGTSALPGLGLSVRPKRTT